MKIVKILLVLSLMISTVCAVSAQNKGEKTVVYNATLHCESCKAKIEKNIPYEKGVKDLKVDMKAGTVTVIFKEDKNTEEGIQKAIEKLSIPVTGIAGKPATSCPKSACCAEKASCDKEKKCEGKCAENCCQKTGKAADCCKKEQK